MPRMPEDSTSVISPYHPANNVSHGDSSNRSYTYRKHSTSLKLTLGWELEANHSPVKVPAGVEHISDGSVDGDGAEFVVMPAITRSPRYVLGLLKELVHAPKLNTNKSCGFHVHVSASNISNLPRMRQWAIATEHLAMQIEDLAFKSVPEARQNNTYCKRIVPISNGSMFSATKYSNSRRYHWLNTVEMFRPGGIRTIEVRLLGNTHRWKYLLAWSLFSMELAQRGWELSNNPFETLKHIDMLSNMLVSIAKDIKPLEKKLDPIPQWVFNGLRSFGIEPNTWDRPLANLVGTEYSINGVSRPIYSDNQPEFPNRERDEDEDDSDLVYCECGCDNEGRCDYQVHEDGDCTRNDCERCHEQDQCDNAPSCVHCRNVRHEANEGCGRSICSICHPVPVRPGVVPIASNVVIESLPIADHTLDIQGLYTNVRRVYSRTMSNTISDASRDALLYGMGIISYNVAMEHLTGAERLLSIQRENECNSRIGCDSECGLAHGNQRCIICDDGWGQHRDHTCRNSDRGSFLIGGR